MDTPHDDADRAKQRFRLALLNLLRQPEAWGVLDDATTEPYTFDLEHRGSTMRVTIGPYPGSERRT